MEEVVKERGGAAHGGGGEWRGESSKEEEVSLLFLFVHLGAHLPIA